MNVSTRCIWFEIDFVELDGHTRYGGVPRSFQSRKQAQRYIDDHDLPGCGYQCLITETHLVEVATTCSHCGAVSP